MSDLPSIPISAREYSEIMQTVQEISISVSKIVDIMAQATLRIADNVNDVDINRDARVLQGLRDDLDRMNREAGI